MSQTIRNAKAAPRPRGLRSLLRSTRGAVYAEAVIIVPFFVIVWGCIVYVHDFYSARIALTQKVKSCAWQYSNNACEQIPAGCSRFDLHQASDLSSGDLPEGGNILEQFANLPVVSGIVRVVLGTNAEARGSGNVARPPVIGGGSSGIASRHSIMCNEVPQSPADLARRMFCNLTHLC